MQLSKKSGGEGSAAVPSPSRGEESPQKCEHDRSPLLFGERVRVRGICSSGGGFRSPYVPCFSIAQEPVNVPGGHKDVAVVVMLGNGSAWLKRLQTFTVSTT